MPREHHNSNPYRLPKSEVCHDKSNQIEQNDDLSRLEHLTTRFSDTPIRGFAGVTSGVATSVITCPLDVVKTKLQGRGGLQLWTLDSVSKRRSFQDRGLIGTGRAIWHQAGLLGMYQGLGPTLLAIPPRSAIYFIVYQKINDSLKKKHGKFPCDAQCLDRPR